MALKIRLRQQGRRNRIVYRLVLSDSRNPRDGKYIESLGWYNPHETEQEKHVSVDPERLSHWLNLGAILSERAEQLVRRAAPQVLVNLRDRKSASLQKARAKRKQKATAAA